MNAISIFSGQGGLDIGVEDAGFNISASIEINTNACDTMKTNRLISSFTEEEFYLWFNNLIKNKYYKKCDEKNINLLRQRLHNGIGKKTYFKNSRIINDDISNIDIDNLSESINIKYGELDLLLGGPPCQSFSKAGKKMALEDERGVLFLEYERFIKYFMPRWFIFENVKGILSTKTHIFDFKCAKCKKIYHNQEPFEKCPICESFGECIERNNIPGASAEIIIDRFSRLGYTCHTKVLNALSYGAPQNRERFIIVGTRDNESFNFPYPTHSIDYKNSLIGVKKFVSVWESLFLSKNPYHSQDVSLDKSVLWVKNIVRPHDEPVTWSLRMPCPTVGAHQSAKLAIAPFGVPEEQIFRQQWHTLGRRQGDTPPVFVEHSYLSDEDLLRIQTFPPYWFVSGTRMDRAIQIGNAVPPLLAKAIASEIAKSC